MVLPIGFEPMTHGLEGRCSIQLSYGSMVEVLGLEPRRGESESPMLPITSYLSIWYTRQDSNLRPSDS